MTVSGTGPERVVLVYQLFGDYHRARVARAAERFASEGFELLALQIFSRQDAYRWAGSAAGGAVRGLGLATTGCDQIRWSDFSIAAWENHEAIFFQDDTLIYDGVGAELFASYEYSERLQLYGGINYTDPDINDPRVDPDFGVEFLILGASLFATKESFGYIELLLSNGKDENGVRVDSVISAGYRFDF